MVNGLAFAQTGFDVKTFAINHLPSERGSAELIIRIAFSASEKLHTRVEELEAQVKTLAAR